MTGSDAPSINGCFLCAECQFKRRTAYDVDGNLSRQTLVGPEAGLVDRTYRYDPAGNLLERSDGRKGDTFFQYDPMDRVRSMIDPMGRIHRLVYDQARNRPREHGIDPGNGLRSTRLEGAIREFDAAGRMIRRIIPEGETRLVWDGFDRLVEATNPLGQHLIFAYDALGRRISKEVNGGKTHFVWDGDCLLGEVGPERDRVREYFFRPESFEPLAAVEGTLFFFENDQVGLPHEVLDQTGNLLWSAHYGPLGVVTRLDVEDIANPLRFQGQYYDDELGLCYNRFPYYDPDSGQFASQDPLGLMAGENLYRYAPNVWGWVDPWGLDCAKGGTYAKVRKANTGGEVHHLPTKQALKDVGHLLGLGSKAPAGSTIHMSKVDHRMLPSSKGQGAMLTQAQADLISQGRFDDAFLLGADEVRAIHGDKYDDAILEAIDALP